MNFLILGIYIVLAWCFHEAGHALVAQHYEMPVKLRFSWRGAGVECGSADRNWSAEAWQNVALAGPAASLVAAVLLWRTGNTHMLSLVNLDFAVTNLLPFPFADGRRAWQAFSERLPWQRRRSALIRERISRY